MRTWAVLVGLLGFGLPAALSLACASRGVAGPVPVASAHTEAPGAHAPDPRNSTSEPPASSMHEATHTVRARERVELDADTWLQVEEVVVEDIAPSPDDPQSYPAGSGLTVEIVVTHQGQEQRGQLTALSAGYDSYTTKWFGPYRVRLVRVDDSHRDPRISLRVERPTERRTSAPPVTVRAKRDREVGLDPDTQLRLVAHGHKITVGDEVSPLLALVELRAVGDEWTRQDVALGPEKDSLSWSWRDFRFTLVDHLYGEWMDLRVERLAVEMVRHER